MGLPRAQKAFARNIRSRRDTYVGTKEVLTSFGVSRAKTHVRWYIVTAPWRWAPHLDGGLLILSVGSSPRRWCARWSRKHRSETTLWRKTIAGFAKTSCRSNVKLRCFTLDYLNHIQDAYMHINVLSHNVDGWGEFWVTVRIIKFSFKMFISLVITRGYT